MKEYINLNTKACHDHVIELNGKSSVMSNIGDSLFKITSLQKLKIEDNFIELSFITPLIDNNARSLKQLELDYSNTNYIVHNGNEFFKLVDFCLTRGHVHQDLKEPSYNLSLRKFVIAGRTIGGYMMVKTSRSLDRGPLLELKIARVFGDADPSISDVLSHQSASLSFDGSDT